MTMKPVVEPLHDSEARVRAAAFRLLLVHGQPVSPAVLARETGIRLDEITSLADQLDRAGRIRRDESGKAVASAGLSVVPDRHQIEVAGRRFWTWCAYDILGIFGALAASGRAWSPSPAGPVIEVAFKRGLPQPSTAVLFRPDTALKARCQNVYEEWCPNSNLFLNLELAKIWAGERGLEGRILSLPEASGLAAAEWMPLVSGIAL